MIVDTLRNTDVYAAMHERIALALDFLKTTDFSKLPDGRIEIDGDDVFAMAQSYTTRPLEDSKWEAHRKYIDVQFIVSGIEKIGVAKTDSLSPLADYDEEGDCRFYEGDGVFPTLAEGDFAIFHPWDAHMPGVACDSPSEVRKVVVKIKF